MNSVPRLRAAVTVVFALNGFMFGSLMARVPAIKADLGLSDGELGVALLCSSLGLVVSQPLAGAASARFGSRPVVAAGVCLYGGLLAMPALAPDLPWLVAAFAILGLGAGFLDVAMNAQGVQAEQRHERAIFSSFHAAFSFGAMAGAGVAGIAAELGVAPDAHLAIVGAAVIAAGLAAAAQLLPAHADARAGGQLFARPTGALIAFAAIGFCALLVEGSASDWSAVLLAEWRDASEGVAAVGLAAFSAAMGTGRLAGDPLRERFGPIRLMRMGAAAALAGTVVVVLPLPPALTIAGFVVVGLGLSAIFPLALLLAAATPGAAPAPAIAAVSTTGYAGLLAGPAIIGGLAELSTLPAALCATALASAAIAALAGVAGARSRARVVGG
ncbi:MAG TPA: MFS transporter [Solirubrobacterales bacterium]